MSRRTRETYERITDAFIALEQAGLVVDLVGHRLVRVPHLDLKRAVGTAAPSM